MAYGPKMRALTEMQRNFVRLWVECGAKPGERSRCYMAAGFASAHPSQHSRSLLQQDNVNAAILEYTRQQVKSGLPEYVAAMHALLRNPDHPAHFKAVDSLMARAGLPLPATNAPLLNINITEGLSLSDLAARARELMAELGGDPTLIPQVIEVEALPAPEEPSDAS